MMTLMQEKRKLYLRFDRIWVNDIPDTYRLYAPASLFMNFSLSQWRKDPFGVWEVIATIMVKNRGALFIFGAFSNSHKPNLSPQPTNNAGLVYPEFFFFFMSFNFI